MLNTQVLPRELTSSVQQLCIERRGEEPFGMDGWGRNFWAPSSVENTVCWGVAQLHKCRVFERSMNP